MPNKILFLTLRIFSATGGIEKVCRVAGKALFELGLQYGGLVKIFSMHGPKGKAVGNKYFPQLMFTGFSGNKIACVLKSIREGSKSKMVLMSHINLLMIGYLIKLFNPSVKLVLLAHGIEVWQNFPAWKKKMLHKCDLILPVSHFTRERMASLHGIPEEKMMVINNCLDPYMAQPLKRGKNSFLLNKYGLNPEHKILLTVSRMVSTERYKGYDRVLQALPELIGNYPKLRYLMVGRYDEAEKMRLDELINILGLKGIVVFTGIIPDEILADHFRLGDLFVMPSEKEGFGIVFIEAMYYGLPVIAGNKDGSVDALVNGEMGLLVDPGNINEIRVAIRKILDNHQAYLPNRYKLMDHFGYTSYKEKFWEVIDRLNAKC